MSDAESAMTTDSDAAEPGWLTRGWDECPHCTQLYVYEMERRCFDCDAPICPVCVEIVRETVVVCPACGRE